jgi:hypothetical protein
MPKHDSAMSDINIHVLRTLMLHHSNLQAITYGPLAADSTTGRRNQSSDTWLQKTHV